MTPTALPSPSVSGSAPTWRQCEEKFWQVNKCLNAGDIPRFRKELGEYNLMLDAFNKATEAMDAKAPNEKGQP